MRSWWRGLENVSAKAPDKETSKWRCPGWEWRYAYEHGLPNKAWVIDCNSLQKMTMHKYDVGRAASPMRPARQLPKSCNSLRSNLTTHRSLSWSHSINVNPDLIISWNGFMCPACQAAKSHKLWLERIKEIFWSNVMQLLRVVGSLDFICYIWEAHVQRLGPGLG